MDLQIKKNSMIQLKPVPYNLFECPECLATKPLIKEVRFESIHVLADCICNFCGFAFYHTFPVGHTVDKYVAIARDGEKVYKNDKCPDWLSNALVKSHKQYKSEPVNIRRVIHTNCSKVVILNTLDSLYGHVLLKLYNALYHLDRQKDIGLILIIPKMFEWLVPKGCAEVWIVDLKLSDLVYGHEAIQQFVKRELQRFSEVFLSKAYSHPDFAAISIERLTGVAPFDLANFRISQPTVTFVLREDRWWLSSRFDYWFYRICRKLKILEWASERLSHKQNRLVKKAIIEIRRKLPATNFHIVGLGRTGRFIGYGSDERKWKITERVERNWCTTYAKSHVVVGIHGSNMLLPTALSAGCVEILPEDRFGNMVQDISVRYNNRLQLFFYRFADQFSSPAAIANKVSAIIEDYEGYNANMCRNIYSSEMEMTTL
jgi:hypothetical protein